MTDENNTNVTMESPVKESKFKKFLHVVFGDMFFKLAAVAGAFIVFLTFKMIIKF